ncbi:MAG: hypothetical protein ABIK12_03470 [Pseudomonadota bacterium]
MATPRTFTKDLKQFRENLSNRLAVNVVAIITTIFTDLVMMTPVDTGRARASWRIGIGAPDLSCEPPGSYGSGIPTGQTEKLKGLTLRDLAHVAIYITNSVEYIVPLEYGHSQQAPGGMVRLTAVKWDGKRVAGLKVTAK